jgi:acetylornithine deacetylase
MLSVKTVFLRMENKIERLTVEAVELLKEMISIPSPSFEEDAVCGHVCKWLTDHGVEHRRVGNNIIAEHIADPTRPTLMLCAHMDTVSPSPEYSFDPYKPENCPEGMVQGLGSNDDGASVVAMIAAYRYFTGDEGIGSGFQNNPSHSFVVGPTPCGQGGSTVLKTTANAANMKYPNLILVLSCEEERSGKNGMTGLWPELAQKVDFAIVGEPTGMKAATSERGLLVIDATAHGISGHAARNEGENALYKALEDIGRLRGHVFEKVSPRMGKVNLNVTQIKAGTAHNVIPDRCDFVIDIRPTEQYSNEEILNELQEICTSELKPRNLANRSSATFEDSPLQKAVEALGIGTFSSPTTSDWMRITCDAIKMGPGESSRSHKKDEFVFVEEIRKGIETYIEFIKSL